MFVRMWHFYELIGHFILIIELTILFILMNEDDENPLTNCAEDKKKQTPNRQENPMSFLFNFYVFVLCVCDDVSSILFERSGPLNVEHVSVNVKFVDVSSRHLSQSNVESFK